MDRNIEDYNNYYDLGKYDLNIRYNYNEIIISCCDEELLDGIKYEAKVSFRNIKEMNNIFGAYNNMKDVYNIINKIIEEGKYEINMINKSELTFTIIGLTQFKLLRQKVKMNNEYLNILTKEIKNIKNNYNNEIKILKDENSSIKNELNELKNMIKDLNLNNNNNNNNNIKKEENINNNKNNITESSINNNDDNSNKIITLNEFNQKFLTDIENNDEVTELDLGYRSLENEIFNLCDIEFNNLIKLDMGGNNISDISVLSKVKYNQLKILFLDNNKISDIKVFEKVNFPLIEEIDLSNNKIEDITVLSKVKFDKLKELYLCENNIKNIDVFENVKFTDLEKLNLSKNKITDIIVFTRINFAHLKLLYLKNNNIDDKIYGSLAGVLKSKIIDFNI